MFLKQQILQYSLFFLPLLDLITMFQNRAIFVKRSAAGTVYPSQPAERTG